jgi:Choline/Carnitine o-acyltransferase
MDTMHCIAVRTSQVTDVDGKPLSRPQIEKQLHTVINMGNKAANITTTATNTSGSAAAKLATVAPVGVLSSQDRDAWADARVQLVNDGNEAALRDVSKHYKQYFTLGYSYLDTIYKCYSIVNSPTRESFAPDR